MESVMNKKRLITELKILTMHPDVQSYFHYETSGPDKESKCFIIYGYLLPRTEPYRHGAYKVSIALNSDFPFKSPVLELLTFIYHPAINNNILQPRFCRCPHHMIWTVGTRISRWLKQFVNIIEQSDTSYAYGVYCVQNLEAESLYLKNREQYDRKTRAIAMRYAHLRPHRSIVSLKFIAKQTICKQLNFQSRKIDQLPLTENLKTYLNSFSHENEPFRNA